MITIPYTTALTTLFSYGLLFTFGHIRDLFRKLLDWWRVNNLHGYAPICLGYEDFYVRRLYHRIQDCFGRPIASAPDAWIDVVERFSNDNNKTLKRTTKLNKCLNLGSYNYLGFAAADEYCTPRVIDSLKKFSPSTCSTRVEGGTTILHTKLEECVAEFVGKPASIVFGMGYVTNSAILPVLIGKGGLIISDSLNHNSIVNGARGSGATIRVFQHNTPSHLEEVLREQIAEGQPRTRRPWKKILVIVEGIYSMEGELCKLPEIITVCKKYKAYIYLDEAHSIGAVGKTGRGVCEFLGVDTADVDIMMGTFTKSFGSCGGYIAGSEELIQYLKYTCPAHLYATSISPPAAQQIMSAIKVILGEDGSTRGAQKLARIRENSNFFRSELQKMGFEVLGDYDSPIMPIMLYNPAKIPAFSRECLKQNPVASKDREDVASGSTTSSHKCKRTCDNDDPEFAKAISSICKAFEQANVVPIRLETFPWQEVEKAVRAVPGLIQRQILKIIRKFNGNVELGIFFLGLTEETREGWVLAELEEN